MYKSNKERKVKYGRVIRFWCQIKNFKYYADYCRKTQSYWSWNNIRNSIKRKFNNDVNKRQNTTKKFYQKYQFSSNAEETDISEKFVELLAVGLFETEQIGFPELNDQQTL